jgi:hypothetical protein
VSGVTVSVVAGDPAGLLAVLSGDDVPSPAHPSTSASASDPAVSTRRDPRLRVRSSSSTRTALYPRDRGA